MRLRKSLFGKISKSVIIFIFIISNVISINFLSAFSLQDIQDEHQKNLEKVFQSLFCNSFGYTLVGEKPMSLGELFESDFDRQYNGEIKPTVVTEYLEKIFRNSKKFIFISRGESYHKVIYLIHKPSLELLIEKEQEFLNNRLKRHVTIDWVIDAIRTKNNQLDFVTLGVLFGYGQSNSFFFVRRMEIGKYLNKSPNKEFHIFYKNELTMPYDIFYRIRCPDVNYTFESYEEEWKWIVKNKAPREEHEVPFLFEPICFIAKKGKETDLIRAKHAETRKKMAEVFCDVSFIEAVVKLAE